MLKLGFLDGKQGFIWYVLQGFWYRFLVDAKIYEIKKKFGFDEVSIRKYLIDTYLTDHTNSGGQNGVKK